MLSEDEEAMALLRRMTEATERLAAKIPYEPPSRPDDDGTVKTRAAVVVDPGDKYSRIDLGKLLGQPIVRIEGYVSREFDYPVFKLSSIVLGDGSVLEVEGEHDLPYVPGLDEAQLEAVAENE